MGKMAACACPSMCRCNWWSEHACAVIARGAVAHGWGVGIHISDSAQLCSNGRCARGGRGRAVRRGLCMGECCSVQAEREGQSDRAGVAFAAGLVSQARRMDRRCRGTQSRQKEQRQQLFCMPTLSPHVHRARTNTRTLATASLNFLATHYVLARCLGGSPTAKPRTLTITE